MPEPTSNPQLERYLRAYMELRDRRAALKRTYEEEDNKVKAVMAKLEIALMQMMNAAGSDNLSVKGVAQAYLTPKTIISAKDWDAVWKYIEESGNLDLLQRRLSQKAVKEFMEANEGDLPPGVDVITERTVVVRTA